MTIIITVLALRTGAYSLKIHTSHFRFIPGLYDYRLDLKQLLALVFLALAGSGSAAMIGVELFDYPNGASIVGQSGGSFWDFNNTGTPPTNNGNASDWDLISGSNPTVTDGTLVTLNNSAIRQYNGAVETNGSVNSTNSDKTVYYSVKLTTGSTLPNFFGMSSYDGGSETFFFGKPFLQPNFGMEIAGSTNEVSSIPVATNTTYILVAKLSYVSNSISLFVDPDLSRTEPATPDATLSFSGASSSTAVRLASGNNDGIHWDDLVVATTWTELAAVKVTTAADEDNGVLGTGSGTSLREAVKYAPSGSIITFEHSLSGSSIVLHSGQIQIDKNLTIDASAIGGITIDGNAGSRIFTVTTGATILFDSLTLTNGNASTSSFAFGGAIYNTNGTLTINNSTITGNHSVDAGGIINYEGTLTLNACTIAGNTASDDAGGIFNFGGPLTINNSTIAGNSATNNGGGIVQNGGSLILNSATVSGNTADEGGGIYNVSTSEAFTLINSVVAGNNAGSDDNIRGAFSDSNSLFSGDPMLSRLGAYGGPTQTMPPLPGSPAIDAGGATTFTNDQRGFARVVMGAVDIGAVESGNALPGVDYTQISSVDDFLNGLTNSGVSLRDAIAFAPAGSTLTFDPALSGTTIVLTDGQILVEKDFTIDAKAIGGITLDGNGLVTSNRIFEIASNTTNVFDSLTLTNGLATGFDPSDRGGAIYVNPDANLTLNNSTLSENRAAFGGGIYNIDSTLTVNNSTLSENRAAYGGGIFSATSDIEEPITSSTTLNQSTLAGNNAGMYGGALYNGNGWTFITNSTIAANTATNGAGVWTFGDDLTETVAANSIIAGNTGNDLGLNSTSNPNAFQSAGFNLVGNGTVSYFSETGDTTNQTAATILLAPLGDFGGPTPTMPPLSGSPAIDGGGSTIFTNDQRAAPRFDGLPDIGAVESQSIVKNQADAGPGSLRDAIGYAPDGDTITFTNTLSGQTILSTSGQFDINRNIDIDASALPGGIIIDGNGSVTGNRIFEIASNTTNVFDSLTLTNGWAPALLSGGAIYVNRDAHLILTNSALTGNRADIGGGIDNRGTLTINNSTIADNTAPEEAGGEFYYGAGIYNSGTLTINTSILSANRADGAGGGIYNANGTLTVNTSTLSANRARSGGGIYNDGTLTINSSTLSGNQTDLLDGGGIFNDFTLTINNSTIAGNIASDDAGGIINFGALTLNACTIAGNTASDRGGGLYNINSGALTINHSTITGNSATNNGGGIYHDSSGSLTVSNSIVAGNTGVPADIVGIFSGSNNITNGMAVLAPLGAYGGPTQTMPPLPGSPAIDAGGSTTFTNDQRGFDRVVNAVVDIGAVEFQGASDLAPLWSTDWDSDGNAFGVEFALGTDWNTADPTNSANLSPFVSGSNGGAIFGFNPDAEDYTAWVLLRSLDLATDPFVEIYRFDGPTGTPTPSGVPVFANRTATSIEITDLSGATNAFYQFMAEPSP